VFCFVVLDINGKTLTINKTKTKRIASLQPSAGQHCYAVPTLGLQQTDIEAGTL